MSATRKLSAIKKTDANANTENESTISGGYDPFKQSNLFHEVYLNVEVPHKFKDIWDPRDPKEFDFFCNAFRNLCSEYDFKDFDSWSEIDTIQNWIIPVLHMLGYYDKCEGTAKPFSLDTSFTYEKKSLRPDFIIVDRPSDLKRIKDSDNSPEQKLSEAREYVKLTIEAKYWDRLEEYKQNKVENKKRADNTKANLNETKDPVEQALEYMKMLHNDWGILTDGKVWRLYHRELSNDSQKRCFQFNLGYLAKFAQNSLSSDSEEQKLFVENAKYFFYLFNKDALFGKEGKGKLLDHLVEYSKEYVHKIEDDLRVRFIQAMTTICNGLHDAMNKPKSEDKLDVIRNVAESHLFNIMFIKSCESRLILPMKGDYLGRSLTRMVQCLKKYKPERKDDDHNLEMLKRAFGNQNDENSFDFKWEGTELYNRLMDLTEFVQKGTNSNFKNFKIEGFTETVFTREEWIIAQKYKVSNKNMVAALFEIGYARPDIKINKYQQIPYNFFTARQLGSIYESFLEFKIDFAEQDIAFIKKQWVPADINSEKIKKLEVPSAKKGSLYFTPNNETRKATGSYYTPDKLVQKTIELTIGPIIDRCEADEILSLRICDPAMGSGHFINAALNVLATEYLAAFNRVNYQNQSMTLQDAKIKVLHNCIYGVDINPRANKLTKMSLWLESAQAGSKLENLENQIITFNSIYLNKAKAETTRKLPEKFLRTLNRGFDAILTNPPWESLKINEDQFFNPYIIDLNKNSSSDEKKKLREKLLLRRPDLQTSFNNYVKNIDNMRKFVNENYLFQKVEIEGFSTAMAEDNLYKIFLELSLNLTKADGKLGIIIPSGILGDIGTSTLRRHLLNNNNIENIIAFTKDSSIFEDVTQSCCMLVIKKDSSEVTSNVMFEVESINGIDEFFKAKSTINLSTFKKISDLIYPIFEISSIEEESAINKLFKFSKIYQTENKSFNISPKCGSNTTYISELLDNKKTQHPIAKGEDVQRYRFNKVSKGYLNPKLILNKKRVDVGDKVALGMISGTTDKRRMRAAVIPDGAWPVNSVNYFESPNRPLTSDEMYFLVGLLNSTSIEFVVRKLCQNNNINIYAIKHLPIISFDSSDSDHKKVVSIVKKLESKYTLSTDSELDALIAKIYGLSKKEYAFILEKYFKGVFKETVLKIVA